MALIGTELVTVVGVKGGVPSGGDFITTTQDIADLAAASSGTVTSVNVDGGTTGLSYSGGPVTTSGTITTSGILVGANGGTGVANTGKTITLGGNLTTSGANNVTFTTGGATNVTLPTTGTLAITTQTDGLGGLIGGNLADQDYRVFLKMPFGGTITETTTRSTAGTATATFKINTTALGGTANSVSTSEQSQAQASSNVFAADDDIVITISANSSCANMSFMIKFTRTLS